MAIPVQNAAYEQQVLDPINQQRAAASLPPLKRNDALNNSSRYQSEDMDQDGYFEHDSYDAVNGAWPTRARGINYHHLVQEYSYLGENIAAGFTDPAGVMTGCGRTALGIKSTSSTPTIGKLAWAITTGQGPGAPIWTTDFGKPGGWLPVGD